MAQMYYTTITDKNTGMALYFGLPGRGPEMKKHRASLAVLLIVAAIALVWIGAFFWGMYAYAEDASVQYVMLKDGDFLNVRTGPGKRYESLGRLESGDPVETDGKQRSGWVHLVNLPLEESDGWVFGGYLVDEAPEQMTGTEPETQSYTLYKIRRGGRVAVRKWVDGPRRGWAKAGSTVKVYAIGGGWALTNRGYLKANYLMIGGD